MQLEAAGGERPEAVDVDHQGAFGDHHAPQVLAHSARSRRSMLAVDTRYEPRQIRGSIAIDMG